MNKRIDLTNLGGFPLEQDTLDFMQDSYRGAFAAIAKLCGSKTILYGVQVAGGNVSSGWISYNGELIPFVGGAVAAQVVITETPAALQATFEDGSVRDVYFTKTATVGVTGDFPFTDLVPLLSLQNMWRAGDIKERYCDAAYIAANFDVDGYGLNEEIGWRILSSAIPAAAGKKFVNLDTGDTDFNEVGKIGGSKTHTLTTPQLPAHNHLQFANVKTNDAITAGTQPTYGDLASNYAIAGTATAATLGKSSSVGGDQAHNNVDPFFVILKLIKL